MQIDLDLLLMQILYLSEHDNINEICRPRDGAAFRSCMPRFHAGSNATDSFTANDLSDDIMRTGSRIEWFSIFSFLPAIVISA